MKSLGNIEAGLSTTTGGFRQGATGPTWTAGTGSPEGVVVAPVGSLYSRLDGGANSAVYRKATGAGNTGWLAMQDVDPTWVGPSAPPGVPTTGDGWYDTDETSSIVLPWSVANGGTGASDAASARTNLAAQGGGSSPSVAGPPTTGAWSRGDDWLDSNNVLWVCTVAGSPGTWMGTNQGEELVYAQITGNVTITATTAATAQLIVNSGTRTYDGSPVIIEFWAMYVEVPNAQFAVGEVYDGATDVGQHWETGPGYTAGTNGGVAWGSRRLTPTVGSHNYQIRGWMTGGTGRIDAGVGTGASNAPAYMRIIRA